MTQHPRGWFVVAAVPFDPDVIIVYENPFSEEEFTAFRKSGPTADLRAMIVTAEVKRHHVSYTEPA